MSSQNTVIVNIDDRIVDTRFCIQNLIKKDG